MISYDCLHSTVLRQQLPHAVSICSSRVAGMLLMAGRIRAALRLTLRFGILARRNPAAAIRALSWQGVRRDLAVAGGCYLFLSLVVAASFSLVLWGWVSRQFPPGAVPIGRAVPSVAVFMAIELAATVGVGSFFLPYSFWKFASPHFGVLAAIAYVLSFPYWYWYAVLSDRDIETDFFSTVGQVLPVLLLAALVDLKRTSDSTTKNLLLFIAVAAAGEFSCLFGLAFKVQDSSLFGHAAAACVGTFVGLGVSLLARANR
ncbi:hypothetical protein OG767_26025 [Micromonospora sp. NBC_01392]|uniref:hypothetical protein n=1 Tax=Micromonospora sp. NBC_01392 TaxID=2903588 RepID=UPI00324AD446